MTLLLKSQKKKTPSRGPKTPAYIINFMIQNS